MRKYFSVLLVFLGACQSAPSAQIATLPSSAPTPVPTASVMARPEPSVQPQSTALPGGLPSPVSTPVAVSSVQPQSPLAQLQSLQIQVNNPFLDGIGQSVKLNPLIKDLSGNLLAAELFPLEWYSSRPADFAVDGKGYVTALVEYGYSEITLKIPGTALSAKQLISVTTLTGTGGGGAAAKATQEKISGSVKFEF